MPQPELKGNTVANLNMFLIMSAVAVTLTVMAYLKDPALAGSGLSSGMKTLWEILPVLIPAFLVGGLVPKVLPQEALGRWLGDESGLRGLVVGTVSGAICPGGPFVAFPLVAGLLKSGAGVAPISAFLTAWGTLALNRTLVFDLPMVGWKFTTARLLATAIFPIVIGLFTRFIYQRLL